MNPFSVVDRRDILPKRAGAYLSFPGLVRVGRDRLLLGYRRARAVPGAFAHGADGDFELIRFADSTWSAPEVLYRHEGAVEEMGCGDLTRTGDGTVVLFSRQWDAAARRTLEVYVATSTDDGATFAPRRPVRLACFPQSWVPYGKVIERPDGAWLLGGYGRRGEREGSSAACLISFDRGQRWKLRSWIAPIGCIDGVANFHEPLMLQRADGSLYALLRTNGVFYATSSNDGGRTWRLPAPAFDGMAAAGLVLSGGDLLVAYRGTSHETHRPGQRPPTVMRRKGRLYCYRTSSDGGATWSPEGVADDGEAWLVGSYGMGDLIEQDDGAVLVVYYTSDRDQAPWLQQCLLSRDAQSPAVVSG